MKLVGCRVGKHRHLLVEPACAFGPVELGLELGVEIAEMHDVAERIGELALGEGDGGSNR